MYSHWGALPDPPEVVLVQARNTSMFTPVAKWLVMQIKSSPQPNTVTFFLVTTKFSKRMVELCIATADTDVCKSRMRVFRDIFP